MNHIPESPPECEALLAEALEALARIPIEGNINDIDHWYRERAFPTLELLDAYFRPDSVTPST